MRQGYERTQADVDIATGHCLVPPSEIGAAALAAQLRTEDLLIGILAELRARPLAALVAPTVVLRDDLTHPRLDPGSNPSDLAEASSPVPVPVNAFHAACPACSAPVDVIPPTGTAILPEAEVLAELEAQAGGPNVDADTARANLAAAGADLVPPTCGKPFGKDQRPCGRAVGHSGSHGKGA